MIYGNNNWSPMTPDENFAFEKFICDLVSENYVNKWDFLNENYGYDSGLDIAIPIKNFIFKKASQMKPFSIIRMNDGEGSVLFGSSYEKLNNYIISRISQIIYNDPRVVLDNLEVNQGLLLEAIKSADIIGAPEKSFIKRRLVEERKENVDIRAVCGSFNQIDVLYNLAKRRELSESVIITSAWLSKYLLAHYKNIMSCFENVVIITGNVGLANKIVAAGYHSKVNEINIPTQRANLGKDDLPHWPERYQQVLTEIENIPEYSLVIVAAGILGKSYCHHAKKCGHGSLDVGHVADIWDGKVSRPGIDDSFVEKWKL